MPSDAEIAAWDAADTLAPHRAAFALPPGVIYLDGNSLGPLPHAACAAMARVMRAEWGAGLIGSWTRAGWMEAPLRVGDAIAPLLGAAPGEVVVGDSTSVMLFKLLAACCGMRPGRTEILTEAGNFPTDHHVAEGVAGLLGLRLRAVPEAGLAAALSAETAVLLLCHVHYRGGARHDMAALTARAHAAGALTLWDLSHSAGAVDLALNGAGADFAVGCGYKFLNGGPGAPGFCYVAARHQRAARPPLQGWMGHEAPFAFAERYAPAAGMRRFLTGTPGILGLAALEAGVAVTAAADAAALRAKSARMFDLFAAICRHAAPGLECLTPVDPALRGSHIAYRHAAAQDIMAALAARGIVGDYRPPDVMRFGLTPLYTRYGEIAAAARALAAEVSARPRSVC